MAGISFPLNLSYNHTCPLESSDSEKTSASYACEQSVLFPCAYFHPALPEQNRRTSKNELTRFTSSVRLIPHCIPDIRCNLPFISHIRTVHFYDALCNMLCREMHQLVFWKWDDICLCTRTVILPGQSIRPGKSWRSTRFEENHFMPWWIEGKQHRSWSIWA